MIALFKNQGKELKKLMPCEIFKTITPIVPINIVTVSWLILPSMVSEIALKRCVSLTYMILPPYSPIRFGVSIVMLHPAKTAFTDLENENLSNGDISRRHLAASMPQLKNINANTNQNLASAQLYFICFQRNFRSGW